MVVGAVMNMTHNIARVTNARDTIKGENHANQIAIDGLLDTNGKFQVLDISRTGMMHTMDKSTEHERHRPGLVQQIPLAGFLHRKVQMKDLQNTQQKKFSKHFTKNGFRNLQNNKKTSKKSFLECFILINGYEKNHHSSKANLLLPSLN